MAGLFPATAPSGGKTALAARLFNIARRVFCRSILVLPFLLHPSGLGVCATLQVVLARLAHRVARVGLFLALLGMASACRRQPTQVVLHGAVIRNSQDPSRQAPIAGVRVAADCGPRTLLTRTDAQGSFTLALPTSVSPTSPVTLHLRHPDYEPLDMQATSRSELYVVRLVPVPREQREPTHGQATSISNVSVRYATKVPVLVEVGTRVQTFQVINHANVLCKPGSPCSPDGRWQAKQAVIGLDAGKGNQFRNARLSCIAGPCPFTRVLRDDFSRGGETISATVLNWSDTATFLLQAEVVHSMLSEAARVSYPVIFGSQMSFSLPGKADGICVEAELNSSSIVFPLGPNLNLSWADCSMRDERGDNRMYRCELKPGFEFR